MPATPRRLFRSCDLFERTAEMHRPCTQTFLRSPWDGAVNCPIHFEGGQTVTITLQLTTVRGGQVRARHPQQLPWTDIAKKRAGAWHLDNGPNSYAGSNL